MMIWCLHSTNILKIIKCYGKAASSVELSFCGSAFGHHKCQYKLASYEWNAQPFVNGITIWLNSDKRPYCQMFTAFCGHKHYHRFWLANKVSSHKWLVEPQIEGDCWRIAL